MQLADHPHRETGLERLPRRDHGHPFDDVRGVLADLRLDGGDGEDRRVGTAQQVGVVVRVLVGDQHRAGAVHRLGVGEHARVDDDAAAVVLEPDAGVTELGDPHGPQPRLAAPRPGYGHSPSNGLPKKHDRSILTR